MECLNTVTAFQLRAMNGAAAVVQLLLPRFFFCTYNVLQKCKNIRRQKKPAWDESKKNPTIPFSLYIQPHTSTPAPPVFLFGGLQTPVITSNLHLQTAIEELNPPFRWFTLSGTFTRRLSTEMCLFFLQCPC